MDMKLFRSHHWIPAFAGMTKREVIENPSLRRTPESSPGILIVQHSN